MLQINCRKISKCKISISQCLLKSVKQVHLLPCTSRGQNRGSDNTVLINIQQVYSIYHRNSSVGEFSLYLAYLLHIWSKNFGEKKTTDDHYKFH